MGRRNRNFATIVYEESAPKDWMKILNDVHIPALISPIHDRDVDEDGVIKKAHFHVLLMYESLKTMEQAKEVFSIINGVGCTSVNGVRAYARYLVHLDNPDKAQYSIEDVIELSGAHYGELIKQVHDKYTLIGKVLDYARENGITSFAEIFDYARENDSQMFMTLCDWPWPIIHYLKSKQWELDKHNKKGYGSNAYKF